MSGRWCWRRRAEKRRQRHADLILAVLAARPEGRFAVDIGHLTKVPAGAVYVALIRLERAGLVETEKVMMLPPGRPLRTLYKATRSGRAMAAS